MSGFPVLKGLNPSTPAGRPRPYTRKRTRVNRAKRFVWTPVILAVALGILHLVGSPIPYIEFLGIVENLAY